MLLMLQTFFSRYVSTQKGGWIILAGLMVVGAVDYRMRQASVAYPMKVLSVNLKDAKTPEQVMNMVATWKRDAWGAQLGAVQVVCDTDRSKLETIVSPAETTILCRVAK